MQARKRPTHTLPTMKTIGKEKEGPEVSKDDVKEAVDKAKDAFEGAAKAGAAAAATIGAELASRISEKLEQLGAIDFSKVKIEPLFEEMVDFDTFSKSDFRAVKVKDCVAVPKSKKLLQFTLDDGTGTDRTILSGIHAYYEPEELVGKTCIAITNLPPRKMMGIDSCGMLLTNSAAIRDVLLFPTMKSIGADKSSQVDEKDEVKEAVDKAKDAFEDAAKAGVVAAATLGAELVSRIGEKLEQLGVIDFSKVKIEPLFEEEVDFDTFSKSDFRAVKVKECVAVPKSTKLLQFTLDDGTGTDRTILSGIHAFYEPEELVGKTCIAITNLPPRKMMGIESCGMLLSAIHEEEGEEKLNLLMVDPHIPAGAKLY